MVTYALFFATAADWLVNISAGWFGASIILPATRDWPAKMNVGITAMNLVFALASFLGALILRGGL